MADVMNLMGGGLFRFSSVLSTQHLSSTSKVTMGESKDQDKTTPAGSNNIQPHRDVTMPNSPLNASGSLPKTKPIRKTADLQKFRDIILRTHLTPYPDEIISRIGGNAPRVIKEIPVKWFNLSHAHIRKGGWGYGIGPRMEVKEVWLSRYELGVAELVEVRMDLVTAGRGIKEEERMFGTEKPLEAKVVVEIDATHEMLNARTGAVAEGCIFYLLDECTAVAAGVLSASEGHGKFGQPGLSQSINVLFHSPAPLGTRLRLVSTSTSSGSLSSKCEVWDLKNRKLVATGTQLHMQPSRSSPSAWL
ncbi:hypothetical protein AX16_004484 [Volvariella volvacea WC 439]|nr:hypothetical protein AX16_004484 [Volvariella volvacea WC 439]